jgi:hypothetical protein
LEKETTLEHVDALSNFFGVPIVFASNGKRATIGGIVHLKGTHYGLTVGHAFGPSCTVPTDDFNVPLPKTDDDDLVFEFDHEEGVGDDVDEVDDEEVVITSQGITLSPPCESVPILTM